MPQFILSQTNSNYLQSFKQGVFGSGIGQSGLVAADIDHDGTLEIIMDGTTSTFGQGDFFYILEYFKNTNEYKGPISNSK